MIKSSKIPLIDINALYGTDTVAKQDVGRQIDAVCRKSGFFQITNHGAEENLKNLTEKTFRFFKDLNFEQKIAMARKKHNPKSAHKYRGFFPATVNGKEGFDIGNPNILVADDLAKLPLNEPTQWPNEIELPGFREYFTNFYKLMTDLARTLLKGFALALGKEENFFDDKVRYEDCMTTLRLNHYPFLSSIDAVEVASDGTRLGTETHKDSSLITILYQPIEGLQVEDNEEGWIDISPSETNLVINTGLLMARWTNDVYQAANHRVKFMNLERISVPFFTEPSYNCSIESFSPDDVNATPLYPTITYGEWITERLQWLPEYRDIFSI